MRFFIDDQEVQFPYEFVYPEQIEYMRALKSSLGKGHAVLEMPTGTGKTITLQSQLQSYQYKYPEMGKLVYCTRTVHEMTKVMAELRNLMKFREKEIARDQQVFHSMFPELSKRCIELLTAGISESQNIVQQELEARLEGEEEEEGVQVKIERRRRRDGNLKIEENAAKKSEVMNEIAVLLEQVVGVLEKEGYTHEESVRAARMFRDPAILAVCLSARKNLCVHPIVSQFDHKERVDGLCRGMTASFVRQKIQTQKENTNDSNMVDREGVAYPSDQPIDIEEADKLGLCAYYEGTQNHGKNGLQKGIYDLDDLKTVGMEKLWCPYYTGRYAVSNADVVVLNYHYILDPKVASVLNNHINGQSVVVFDEAHNIDNICVEAMSITMNKNDILSAARSVTKIRSLVQQQEEHNEQKQQEEYTKLVNELLVTNRDDNVHEQMEIADTPVLSQEMLQDTLPGSVRRARHFVSLLQTTISFMKNVVNGSSITQQTPELFLQRFSTETGVVDAGALVYAYDRLSLLLRTLEVEATEEHGSLLKMCSFLTLCAFYGLKRAQTPHMKDLGTAGGKDSFVVLFEPTDANSLPDPRLQLVCVDASIAMHHVTNKFQSVVLTSGTMSPLDMLPKMLGLKPLVSESFSMSLSRDVIAPLVVTKSNDQTPLTTSYSFRETHHMAGNYGHFMLSLVSSVPDGMVVFFPSYTYMEYIMQEWKKTGIQDNILRKKQIFLETKDIEETTLALTAYRKACASGRGGIFFSIARGKVSEGIDFSGHLGRAVVLIGVPYQYTKSRQLLCRLDFLRDKIGIKESEYLHFDAIRQTAQCIGRIVRSKNDYGVVILADQRFSRQEQKSKLPKWILNFFVSEHGALSSESALYAAKQFFKESCMRGDIMSEPGVRGKVQLDGEEAARFALKDTTEPKPKKIRIKFENVQ